MKILTKEEEQEHYYATLTGGIGGGVAGLALGSLGTYVASTRYPAFRSLSLPFRAFLITSSATFAAIVSADRASRGYEKSKHPDRNYQDEAQQRRAEAEASLSTRERVIEWAKENRYPIVFGSWVASMGIALGLVGRNPYLSGQQKLVQARVYAQGLTLAVLVASFAIESTDASKGEGRWQTVKIVDPNDPTHTIEKKIHKERYAGEDQWRDMVESQERRLEERKKAIHEQEEKDAKHGKIKKPAPEGAHDKRLAHGDESVKAP